MNNDFYTFCAYIAGVIDSDGSISVTARHRTRANINYSVMISISWNKSHLSNFAFKKMQKYFKGGVYNCNRGLGFKSNVKKIHRYSCYGKDALYLLENILPFLILKRRQAKNSINLLKRTLRKYYNGSKRKPEELIRFQDSCYLKNKKMNTKNNSSISKQIVNEIEEMYEKRNKI